MRKVLCGEESLQFCNALHVRDDGDAGLCQCFLVQRVHQYLCEGKNLAVDSQQGTFRFPYSQIDQAVTRGLPGWTVLIHTGNYANPITINKKITLEADGGTVIIGQ